MTLNVTIRNEADAWRWLKRAVDGDDALNAPLDLKFVGWPTLDLRYKGRDFDSSVPTRIMPSLLEAQQEIHRVYCQARYGQQALRKLTSGDRERLELVVRVKRGSSSLETNLDQVLTETARAAIASMDSVHILMAVVGVALIWGSNIAWKNWLDTRAKEKDVDSRVQLSRLEKEKLQVLSDAYRKAPEIKALSQGVDDFRNDSLHKLKPADSFSIPDSNIDIDGSYAAEITHRPREESIELRLDGQFTIQSVDSGAVAGFRIKVRRLEDGAIISVRIPEGTLTAEQREVLKNNEWAKTPVLMQINARELRGEITSATLVSVQHIPRRG